MSEGFSWLAPGKKVVCINDEVKIATDKKRLEHGKIYTIAQIVPNAVAINCTGYLGIHLVEVKREPVPELGGIIVPYGAHRFRPVVDEADDLKLFKELLNTLPAEGAIDELEEATDYAGLMLDASWAYGLAASRGKEEK